MALVAAADLVAADGAAVVLVDRAGARVGDGLPDDLVEDDAPPARRASAGVLLAEPDLEGRLLAGSRGDRLERGVEVADVRRPEDDLGEQPGQRARLQRRRPALAIDRRAGHPATPAVEVDHDVTEARVGLDPGGDELGRRGRRQAAERREREPRLAPDRNLATRHGRHPATVAPFRRVNAGPPGDVPLGDSIASPRRPRVTDADPASDAVARPSPAPPADGARAFRALHEATASAVVGAEEPLRLLTIALLAEGHALIEDVPGIGKTLLARAFARALGLGFGRIQGTPDLLPSDVTGASVLDGSPATGMNLRFVPGPVFTNVLLVDEINRATPRTQSALLEAMQERQVSVEGVTRRLPDPFLVLATQNPIEYEGTFALPEAQLDRFLLRLRIGYPDAAAERRIAARYVASAEPLDAVRRSSPADRIAALREGTRSSGSPTSSRTTSSRSWPRPATVSTSSSAEPAGERRSVPGRPGVGVHRRAGLRPPRRRPGDRPGRPRPPAPGRPRQLAPRRDRGGDPRRRHRRRPGPGRAGSRPGRMSFRTGRSLAGDRTTPEGEEPEPDDDPSLTAAIAASELDLRPLLGGLLVLVGGLLGIPIVVMFGIVVLVAAWLRWLWATRALRRLRLERRFEPDRVVCGDVAHMVVTAWNRKLLPLPWLRTEELLPIDLRPEDIDGGQGWTLGGRTLVNGWTLGPYERVIRRIDLRTTRRGVYRFDTVELVAGDLLGESIADEERRLATSLVVRPRTVPVRRFDAARDRAGPLRTRHGLVDDPSRFAGVRPTCRAIRSATSTGGPPPGSGSRSSSGSTRRATATSSSPSTSRPTTAPGRAATTTRWPRRCAWSRPRSPGRWRPTARPAGSRSPRSRGRPTGSRSSARAPPSARPGGSAICSPGSAPTRRRRSSTSSGAWRGSPGRARSSSSCRPGIRDRGWPSPAGWRGPVSGRPSRDRTRGRSRGPAIQGQRDRGQSTRLDGDWRTASRLDVAG